MLNIRQLRRRIRSVQSTAKITKAMEMIAASKMRKAQQLTLAARPYSEKILDVMAHLMAQRKEEEDIHPLLKVHPEVRRIQIVHVTTDRGLCGALNGNVNRRAAGFILEQRKPISVVAVGRKGRDFMHRTGQELRAVFVGTADYPTVNDILPIAKIVRDDYTSGYVDRVYLSYTEFVNTLIQRPVLQQILPVEPAKMEGRQQVGYIYEPNPAVVLDALLPRFLEMQIYHALLEARASEQSARMVAMRSATENALDMINELTLLRNKVRQEMITKELLDIVGGVASLEKG
ncbi:MAG: ATP synthase F1 subunit gamma [Dehalococcoidia bacterium]|nr:ATP synthase F1 subunit gamma [Dehalococcoidia bacterium]